MQIGKELSGSPDLDAMLDRVVAITSPTDSEPMAGSLLRKSMSEVRTAAA